MPKYQEKKISEEELATMRAANSSRLNSLQLLMSSGIMAVDRVQEEIDMTRKEIIKQHELNYSVWQGTGKDTRWKTRLPDGKLKAKTERSDLDDIIVDFYREQSEAEEEEVTLRNLYPKFLEAKKLSKVRDTTLTDYRVTWNKYFEQGEPFSDKDLTKLTRGEYKRWALDFLSKHPMKRKAFNKVRTLVVQIIDYAADWDYLPDNKIRAVTIPTGCFLPDVNDSDEQVYTNEELDKLIPYLWERYEDDINYVVPLAILFSFCTGLRVAELEAIRFSDVDSDGFLHIQRQQLRKMDDNGKLIGYEVIEKTKSKARAKPVYVPEEGRAILKLVREVNERNGDTEEDYVFYVKHKLMTTNMYNSFLGRACEKVGIPIKRSHKIRKTYGTILADAGVSLTMIQAAMGHSTPDVTLRCYIKPRSTKNEMAAVFEDVIGKSVTRCNTLPEKIKTQDSAEIKGF